MEKLEMSKLNVLVARFLEEQNMTKSLQAFQEESGCDMTMDLQGKGLVKIVDEWCELQSMLLAKDGEKIVSLGELFEDAVEDQISGEALYERESSGACLCAGFIGDNVYWADALKTLHCLPVIDEIDQKKGEWSGMFPDIGAILCIAECGDLLVCGSQSGGLSVFSKGTNTLLYTLSCHRKYTHRVSVSKSGTWIATASHDKSVAISKFQDGKLCLTEKIQFDSIPECIVFREDKEQLIIGVRDSNYIRIVDLKEGFLVEKVNVNEMHDDHVSYNILDISVSPVDSRIIAIASDKDRVFVYCLENCTCTLLSVLTGGIKSDGYAQTRVIWSHSSRIIYCSSSDGNICCFDVVTSKVKTIKGHKAAIRDMAIHPTQNMLASVSFDKAMIVWN